MKAFVHYTIVLALSPLVVAGFVTYFVVHAFRMGSLIADIIAEALDDR